MILLIHMLFGAAIGSRVANPFLAIILAWLGHYFLDVFPHIEYLTSAESSIKNLKYGLSKKNISDLIKVSIDVCIGIALIFLLSKNQPIVYVCAFFAIIPDGLTVVTLLFPNKLLMIHHQIHTKKIHFLKYKKISNVWRVATQVLAFVISVLLLRL